MSDAFRDYIEAELSHMVQEIGPSVKPGSTRFNMKAIQWIEENAADFRMHWKKNDGSPTTESGLGCKDML